MNLTKTDIQLLVELIDDATALHFINESEIGPDYEDGGQTELLEKLRNKLLKQNV